MPNFLDSKFKKLFSEFTRYKSSIASTDRPKWIPKPDTEDEVPQEDPETWWNKKDKNDERRHRQISGLTRVVIIIGLGTLAAEPREFRQIIWTVCDYTIGFAIDICPKSSADTSPSNFQARNLRDAYLSGLRNGIDRSKRPPQFTQIIVVPGHGHLIAPYRRLPNQGWYR